jgi:hypothetical protein
MRKLSGILCLFFGLGILTKAGEEAVKAIRFVNAPATMPGKSLYAQEHFIAFGLLLIFAGFLLRQGLRLWRRPQMR